jgi:beta-phosphoglucomutase-like phosphatase (HAD superfamily)
MTRPNLALDGLIFDFDGVIIESVQIKTDAFFKLFLPYGDEIAEAAKRLHLDNLGMSRYAKFEIIFRDWLDQPLSPEKVNDLDRSMSQLIREGMMDCEFVPGAVDALSVLHKVLPLTVASGTPMPELNEIARTRDVSKFFKVLYGSPAPKPDLVGRILQEFAWDPARVVLIGDATNDLVAATAHSVNFIGRVPSGEQSPFGPEIVDVLQDLHGLVERLQTRYSA